jgi:hypothetical protein
VSADTTPLGLAVFPPSAPPALCSSGSTGDRATVPCQRQVTGLAPPA